MSPSLTICIPVSRSSEVLQRCLQSIHEHGIRDQYTILLIAKDKLDVAQINLSNTQIIKQQRYGLTGAMNDALARIETPLFARIDDDVTVSKTWMQTVINSLTTNTKIGGVTGPTVIPADEQKSRDVIRILTILEKTTNPLLMPIKWLYLSYLYEGNMRMPGRFLRSGVFTLGSNFEESLRYKKPFEVDYAEACNYAFRTEMVRSLGGFDSFYSYGLSEYHEPDMAYRIRKKGHPVMFYPQAAVTHHVGIGVARSRGEAMGRIRNFIHFYRTHLDDGTVDSRTRFAVHILLQNCYYAYTFLRTGDISNLGAFIGTIKELISSPQHISL